MSSFIRSFLANNLANFVSESCHWWLLFIQIIFYVPFVLTFLNAFVWLNGVWITYTLKTQRVLHTTYIFFFLFLINFRFILILFYHSSTSRNNEYTFLCHTFVELSELKSYLIEITTISDEFDFSKRNGKMSSNLIVFNNHFGIYLSLCVIIEVIHIILNNKTNWEHIRE